MHGSVVVPLLVVCACATACARQESARPPEEAASPNAGAASSPVDNERLAAEAASRVDTGRIAREVAAKLAAGQRQDPAGHAGPPLAPEVRPAPTAGSEGQAAVVPRSTPDAPAVDAGSGSGPAAGQAGERPTPAPAGTEPAPAAPGGPVAAQPASAAGEAAPVSSVVWRVTVSDTDRSLGPASALVTVVVWGDYECPVTRRLFSTLKTLVQEQPETLRVVWKNNPLQFHKGAWLAAAAACAAGAQGRFWDMHDALLQARTPMNEHTVTSVATEQKLDTDRFARDWGGSDCRNRVNADLKEGTNVGVVGTPTTFVNGRELKGAVPIDVLRGLVASEAAAARQLVESGASAASVYDVIVSQGQVFKPFDETVQRFDSPAPGKGEGVSAVLVLTLFLDYECSYSARFRRSTDEVLRQFQGLARVEVRQLPLPFHPNARLAAEAAMAAHDQGKFWQMNEKLFSHSDGLDRQRIESIAEDVRLDMDPFRAALDSHATAAVVDAYVQEATDAQVKGTPALFVNGRRYLGQLSDAAALATAIRTEFLGGAGYYDLPVRTRPPEGEETKE